LGLRLAFPALARVLPSQWGMTTAEERGSRRIAEASRERTWHGESIVRGGVASLVLLAGVGALAGSLATGCGPEDRNRRAGADAVRAPAPPAEELAPADVDRANAQDFAKQPARIDWSRGDAERGARSYMQACWICHGAAGRGRGPAADQLNPKPRDFRVGSFTIDANANGETGEAIDLARVILVGAEPFGGSELMQGWHEVFTEEEVRDLVAYVRSLGAGSAAAPPRR